MMLYDVRENFGDFIEPSLQLITPFCDGKCWRELNLSPDICQNEHVEGNYKTISNDNIIRMFNDNKLCSAILISGREPFDEFEDLINFVDEFRENNLENICIYTGFYPREIGYYIEVLKRFPNIYVKYGRYNPNLEPKYDEVLKLELASSNQWAEKIS